MSLAISTNSKWTSNGYAPLIQTLKATLTQYRILPEILLIIADFCHFGLAVPSKGQLDAADRCVARFRSLDQFDYVRSDKPFRLPSRPTPTRDRMSYFEVGFGAEPWPLCMAICIGLSADAHWSLSNPELGRSHHSIGLRSDDGKVYCGQLLDGKAVSLRRGFGMDDVIGCGYDVYTKRVFFTKNGHLIASEKVHWADGRGEEVQLRATAVMCSDLNESTDASHCQCSLRFNFGAQSFRFDVNRYDGHVVSEAAQFLSEIMLH